MSFQPEFKIRAFGIRRNICLLAIAAAAVLLLNPSFSKAILPITDAHWNVSSGDWSAADNWFLRIIPGFMSNAYVDNGTATITQSGAKCSTLILGSFIGNNGTVEITGGDFSADSALIGMSGMGTINQSGGTATMGDVHFGYYSTGNGVYNLTGGTLIAQMIEQGPGIAAFNFGGGTLQINNNFAPFTSIMPMTLTGIGGNANIDAEYSTNFSAPLSGPGGLNKLGFGTLTLSSKLNYSGDTIIKMGRLVIAGGIDADATSLIDVQANSVTFETVNINKPNLNINTISKSLSGEASDTFAIGASTGNGSIRTYADSNLLKAYTTFEVANGTHTIGAITGSGIMTVDAGANLTAASINQDILTIASGATVTIAAIPGGPLGGAIAPVPEPSTYTLLSVAFIMAIFAWSKKRIGPRL